jgi:hypothetical protein
MEESLEDDLLQLEQFAIEDVANRMEAIFPTYDKMEPLEEKQGQSSEAKRGHVNDVGNIQHPGTKWGIGTWKFRCCPSMSGWFIVD